MVPEAKSTRIVKAFQEDKRERGVSKAFVEVALKDWGWGTAFQVAGQHLATQGWGKAWGIYFKQRRNHLF